MSDLVTRLASQVSCLSLGIRSGWYVEQICDSCPSFVRYSTHVNRVVLVGVWLVPLLLASLNCGTRSDIG